MPFDDRTIILFGNGVAIMWEIRILGMGFLGSSAFLFFKSHRPFLFVQFLYGCLCFYQIVCFDRLSNLLVMVFNLLIFLWNLVEMLHSVEISYSLVKSISSSISKFVTMTSVIHLAISIWFSMVNMMCLVRADFSIFIQNDADVTTIERGRSFYCNLLGTPENPSTLSSLPNEMILFFMMSAGWVSYISYPNRMVLLSTLLTVVVFINALPTYWMLMNVCNATTNLRSLLLTGAIVHLFGCCMINTSVIADVINFYIVFIRQKKKEE